ncbi:TOM1-like protein 2 isoform X1 [Petromyzon marinus]|uniref:TOM1-like protein 2 isoform X1 n=1 Tax=Petromyzon marinus TaxID=7757 RepID=UPI003F6FAC07
MAFLLLNAFSSPVGQRIEKATDGSLPSEDWNLNIEICDIINETDEGPKDAVKALKKRIGGNKNFKEVMLALTVLETCVKNCGHRFHVLIASQDFVDGVLVRIIQPKNNPPTIVQEKVLSLVQTWADAFRSAPDLTGVVHVYEDLKRKGVEFPMTDLDALSPIHTPQRSTPEADPAVRNSSQGGRPAPGAAAMSASAPPHPLPPAHAHAASVAAGPISPTPEQVAKLRSELDIVECNVKVMSQMLTELVPGQVEASDLQLLQALHQTCRTMQQRVIELVPRVSSDEVTAELLRVNDDLLNIFLRYDRFERYRASRAAQQDPMEGAGLAAEPGALAPAATSRQPAAPSSQAANTFPDGGLKNPGPGSLATNPPDVASNSLASQLASIGVAGDSVTGTLSALGVSSAVPAKADTFDMFAQSRGSSLADQRKHIVYEDPQAVTGLAGALDARQHNTGAIPVAHVSSKDEVDAWLLADSGKGDETAEVATSGTTEAFDSFLASRANVAEKLPDLPMPPLSEGPARSSVQGKKKMDKMEDSLFAL